MLVTSASVPGQRRLGEPEGRGATRPSFSQRPEQRLRRGAARQAALARMALKVALGRMTSLTFSRSGK
jgi:hypothetical protein